MLSISFLRNTFSHSSIAQKKHLNTEFLDECEFNQFHGALKSIFDNKFISALLKFN